MGYSENRKNIVNFISRFNNISYNLQDIYNIFYLLLIVSLIIKGLLSLIKDPLYASQGEATSVLWGYGMIFFTIMSIYIFKVQELSNTPIDQKYIFYNMFFLLFLILIGITIFLNISNYTEINKGNMPNEYFKWSLYNYVIVFIISISIILIKNIDSNIIIGTTILLFIYLLIVIVQNIIINNFTVDG